MKRRQFIAGCSLTAAATLSDGQRVNAAAPSDLVGTWKLLLYEDRPAGGKPEYPYGVKAVGLLIYDSTGHMSVQISQPPTPKGQSGKHKVGPDEERAAAYTAYFGTYTVDWAKQIITHTVEGNLYPAYVGTSHERPLNSRGIACCSNHSGNVKGNWLRASVYSSGFDERAEEVSGDFRAA